MKTENIYIYALKREFTFYIGKNQSENFEVIDKGASHANNVSSCHVVCHISEVLSKKELQYIVKAGALLCKNNTNKLKSEKNVEILYTCIKNVIKTDIPGSVITQNTKTIIC
jgi:predicted ribosome quality control (RQC) complex YloA/Tae2 family protein